MIALLLMALVLAFAFNSLIVGPAQEVDELPVVTSFLGNDPSLWMSQDVYVVVVRIFLSFGSSVNHPSLGSPDIGRYRTDHEKNDQRCE